MVLAVYRSLSHRSPPFASPNIAGLSVTHSGYWHPLLPAMYPRNYHLIYHKFIPQKLPHSKLQRNSRYSSKGEWSYLFKKKQKKKKRSPLSISSCKLWSSNKWEAIHSIHSIPSKNPMFHETWIWQSTDCRCLPPGLLRDTLSSKVCR